MQWLCWGLNRGPLDVGSESCIIGQPVLPLIRRFYINGILNSTTHLQYFSNLDVDGEQ
jgi:hypothetical protein